MFETFDHTADLGLRVRAANLDALFAEAGLALFSAVVENPSAIRPEQERSIRIEGDDLEFLLLDWLKSLLSLFDIEGLVLNRFEVRVSSSGLEATVRGEPLDRSRHEPGHEVKAITCHGLRLEPVEDGWLAEVIVDI